MSTSELGEREKVAVPTVEVPIDLLTEAAGFLDALDTLAERFDVDLHEEPSDGRARVGRAMELRSGLVMCDPSFAALYDDDLDDYAADKAIDAHPVEQGHDRHSKRVVTAFEARADNIIRVLLEDAWREGRAA